MATKDSVLKRKLIKEGIIAVVILAMLGAGGMTLSNYDDDATADKRVKDNETSAMQAEYASVKQQLESGFEVSAFYKTYIKSHNEDLVLNREIATQLITALHEKNHLTNLNVTIAPVTDAGSEFSAQMRSGTTVKSQIRMSFGSVTDNSIFRFIEDLERKLPGMVLIQDIKLTRNGDLTRDVLVDLSQHKITPLVSGDVSMTWLGIRPTDQDKNASSTGTGNGAR